MRDALPLSCHLRDQVTLLGSVVESLVADELRRRDRTTRVVSDTTGEVVDHSWPDTGEHLERKGNLFAIRARFDSWSNDAGIGRREIIGEIRLLHAGRDMLWISLDWREGASDPDADTDADTGFDDLEDEPMVYRQRLSAERFEHRSASLPWEMLANSSGWRETYKDRMTEMLQMLHAMAVSDAPGVSAPSIHIRADHEFQTPVWVHDAADEPDDGYTRRVLAISPRELT